MHWGRRGSHTCFPIPGNHKFIFWESYVFCDLHFLTLGLGTCLKETEWFFLDFFFFSVCEEFCCWKTQPVCG